MEIRKRERTRSHDAHVAFQDVPKLWDFIETPLANDPPDPGQAKAVGEKRAVRIADFTHRSKFPEGHWSSIEPGAKLMKEDRSFAEKKAERNGRRNGREEDSKNDHQDQIEDPLYLSIGRHSRVLNRDQLICLCAFSFAE